MVIKSVMRGLPAEAAGLRAGDLIMRVGEDEIGDMAAFQKALARHLARQRVTLGVQREGKRIEVEVVLDAE